MCIYDASTISTSPISLIPSAVQPYSNNFLSPSLSMGNSASCFCSESWKIQMAATLLATDGSLLRQIQLPVKAAEIMLEEPGYVVSSVDELQKTRHVSAMRADDELLAGQTYLLVPLSRNHSRISTAEFEKLGSTLKKRSKSNRSSPKVQPATIEESEEKTGSLGYQLGNQRRWNPALETIAETL